MLAGANVIHRTVSSDQHRGQLRREPAEGLLGYDPDEYVQGVLPGGMPEIAV